MCNIYKNQSHWPEMEQSQTHMNILSKESELAKIVAFGYRSWYQKYITEILVNKIHFAFETLYKLG